ncbi:hypothetical protein LINGRAHAP2_LOCUS35602 [Linum grandiflorum]
MTMFNNNEDESIRGLMLLKLFTRKLQRTLMMMTGQKQQQQQQQQKANTEYEEDKGGMKEVPNDVKRGQFAVTATKGGKPKRFIVELDDLNDPDFLNLLELSEDKFGFCQAGVLEVPCLPAELQKVLRGGKIRRASSEW